MSFITGVLTPFEAISRHKQLIISSVWHEIAQKYRGSLLGVTWAVLYPLCLFFIYTTLYLVIFRVRPLQMTSLQYVIYIMSGLIPFLGFSESLAAGTVSLSNKKSLLLNTIYPSEFIPFQVIISSHMSLFVGALLLIIATILLLGKLSFLILLLPIVIILQLMFVCGIVWYLSIFNLVVKDIQQALGLLTMLMMIISPIAYTPDMVPGALKFIIWLNPFSYFARTYQAIFLNHQVGMIFMMTCLISILSFYSGYYFFCKVKRVFHDYV